MVLYENIITKNVVPCQIIFLLKKTLRVQRVKAKWTGLQTKSEKNTHTVMCGIK